jgi:16S rRNA (guanine966-N2)-methyltransferase
LPVPDQAQLRPTPDRVRETVFNWLRDHVAGSVCLDLYAGTGALGFEAASRGAARVYMVERDRDLAAAIQDHVDTLRAHMVEIACADALQWLAETRLTFDLILLDPPFGEGLVARCLKLVYSRTVLRPCGLIYVEAERGLTLDLNGFQSYKSARAGQIQYMLLEQIKREY